MWNVARLPWLWYSSEPVSVGVQRNASLTDGREATNSANERIPTNVGQVRIVAVSPKTSPPISLGCRFGSNGTIRMASRETNFAQFSGMNGWKNSWRAGRPTRQLPSKKIQNRSFGPFFDNFDRLCYLTSSASFNSGQTCWPLESTMRRSLRLQMRRTSSTSLTGIIPRSSTNSLASRLSK